MLSSSRYRLILFVQVCLLLFDLLLNAFADFLRQDSSILLLLFIIQDGLQVLAVTLLLVSLFQTNVFQAGFVELLFDRFRTTVFIAMLYFLLTLIVQIYVLSTRWFQPMKHYWAKGLPFFFISQRFCSCIYYYLYKRAMLRISDPRFYDDEWINHKVNLIT
ncbi:transmembrane protein 138 [Nilaparvata lugens]|uniref:transmembrane protein 138 n=1 Tax=Nilaparvata lugens TaxID=108931 RepID=UPI000B98C874|nr:transmembrane protein 138 [Nilaparvata lugens]